jgi:hypothetical protein
VTDLIAASTAPQASCPNRVFEARDDDVAGEVTGQAADEHIAAGGIEAVFRGDARVGAAQHRGKGILAAAQRLALMLEVVPPADAIDVARIALHQTLERGVGRENVFRLWRLLGLCHQGLRRQRYSCGQPELEHPPARQATAARSQRHLAQRHLAQNKVRTFPSSLSAADCWNTALARSRRTANRIKLLHSQQAINQRALLQAHAT